jgi:N-acetylmuramoyl-L-alanine amidase
MRRHILTIATALAVAVASAGAATAYRVRPGDTLTQIALAHGTSVARLEHLNGMAPDDVLLAGAILKLPSREHAASSSGTPVRDSIIRWSNHYGVDPRLASALAWMESGFNNRLVSSAGAVGVMQITPVTWDYVEQVLLLGRTVAHDLDGNVRIGVALLHHLLHVYGGDERRALAAYYQGPRSLQVNGPLPETLQYVANILALKLRF